MSNHQIQKAYKNILSYPAPRCLVFCEIFGRKTRKGEDGNKRCRECPEHIPCVRYIEAQLWSKGIEVTRSWFADEEEKEQMEKYLRAIGYREEEG